MCDPVTLAMSALQGVGSVAGIQGQNSYAAANATNANQSANDQYAASQLEFVEKSRSLIQGGFDQVLAGREAESSAYASALENGVQGASVKAMLRDKKQKAGRNVSRTNQELKSLTTQTGENLKHVRTQPQARINSAPTTSFGLGDIGSMLAPIVKAEME